MTKKKQASATTLVPGALTALLREAVRAPGDGTQRPPLRRGQMVGRRFEVVREIGRGGFGVVYEARDHELPRTVALKSVRTGDDFQLREERLLREAEAAAQLSHPNIVTLYDVGRSEQGPYLVMELLQGSSLAERLGGGALPLREALRVAIEVARAIAHAHAKGVVHRDLTPGNVFLCEDGQVKILDLGMAQAFGRRKVDGGTIAYMAPEQVRGAPEDERTDVFALGVILYEAITGSVPFADASALQATDGEPAPATAAHPALAELVARMLKKDPVGRPRDGGEVLAALTEMSQAVDVSRAAEPPRAPRRSTRWPVFAGAVLLLASGTYVLVHEGAAGGAPAAPSAVAAVTPPSPGALERAREGARDPAPPPVPPSTNVAAVRRDVGAPSDAHRVAPSAPRPAAADAASGRVLHCRDTLNAVEVPEPATGDGVLAIDADAFGTISLNGRPFGETPEECRVSAGTYRVRVVHAQYGTREARVEVRAGQRTRWTADFLGGRAR